MVFPPNDMILNSILSDLLSRSPQQRTDDNTILRSHSFQTTQACTAQQVDEKSLSLVVGMMGYSDFVITQLLPQLLKPGITQVSGSHLNGYAIFSGIFLGFKMLYKALYSTIFRKLAYKPIITV